VVVAVLLRLLLGYMRHKEIMAAIEKGVDLSEFKRPKLKAPGRITSISIGIGLLILSLPFLFMFLEPLTRRDYVSQKDLLLFGIFFAVGLGFFIRGLLLRKAQGGIESSYEDKAGGNETGGCASK